MNMAVLVTRLFFGLGIAAHGTQKLFGWFGGHGLDGTGGFFETIGFRPVVSSRLPLLLAKPSVVCCWQSVCSGLWGLRSCSWS